MWKETIDDYILRHSDEEGQLLAALNRDAHVNLLQPRMLSGHLQGRFLKMLCRMARPARVLEIGTYTGYATLCLAEGLPTGGHVDTIELNDEMEDFIRKYLEQSPFRDRVTLHIGDARAVIPTLEGEFDLVFIDPPYDANLQEKALAAVIPRLSEAGLLYVETPDAYLSEEKLAALGLLRLRGSRAGVVHYQLLTRIDSPLAPLAKPIKEEA